MSKYPIGATWKGTEEKSGKIGYIWLEARHALHEFWKWSVEYSDGSSPHGWLGGDWGTSYRMCKDQMGLDCRMKRVK